MNSEKIYQLALSQIPGIGPILARNLLGYCGSPEAVFREKAAMLTRIPGIGSIAAKSISKYKDFDRVQTEIDFIQKANIQSIFITDAAYPHRLKPNIDAPIVLFIRGNHDLEAKRMVGIVGTRSATTYGKEITQKLVSDLAELNCTVVSGMAYGIDIIAHKSCLEHNVPTVGVLAHGLDRIYPPSHHNLAEKMVSSNGALVTEYFSGTIPDRENFPQRNRIVAGLIDVLLVIQTAKKGGSMITADLAFQYDREVMAFPGRINDDFAAGCHHLIKNQKAHLIENIQDLVKLMNYDIPIKKQGSQQKLPLDLSDAELHLIGILKEKGTRSIDMLGKDTGFSVGKLAQILLQLELKDLVCSLPGKNYNLA